MACFALIERVDTQVAMAFGASVQPFTNTTPNTNITVIKRAGFAINWLKKSPKEIVMIGPPIIFSLNYSFVIKILTSLLHNYNISLTFLTLSLHTLHYPNHVIK